MHRCNSFCKRYVILNFDCKQALLDMYTIQREIGRLDNIKVGLVGDLANGRTVRSLAYLLARYSGVKIFFVSPDVVKMKVAISCPFLGFTFPKQVFSPTSKIGSAPG